jgi:chromosome segregation ATPase
METTRDPRAFSPDRLAGPLAAVLEALIAEHEALAAAAEAHRAALRSADAAALAEANRRSGDVLARIAELEDKRRALITTRSGTTPKLSEVCAAWPAEARERVLALGEKLRELAVRVREEFAAVRQASQTLAEHLRGVMHQVAASLSHAGTYGPSGRVDPTRAQVVSGLDLRR